MAELPSGTVTFLFTDIEGSTRLLHELGDAYADVLAEHRRVLRAAFARNGGIEVDTQGDAFFVAFARASDALAAAGEAQAGLNGGPVRVRIGVHTGEPLVTDEGYVGIDVHRAARIAAVGHGRQVLVSQSTVALVPPSNSLLLDLGEHRLKDLTAPERIFQLGEGDFPPLKSLNTTNLPVAASPLVGRERELREVGAFLNDSSRLVTLTGPGGTGKTRLGLQVAAELVESFRGGVFFIALAGVHQPDLVPATIGATVGVRSLDELGDRDALLMVDNFEHLLDAAPTVSDLLASAPAVKVLATSRAPLRVDGEREYPVDPLPDDEAVELLTERARAVRPAFVPDAAAEEVCRRLDGLPLALELAASRLRSIEPAALLERLDRRLPLLTGGRRDAPERQRTLRATIEWSYDLLDSPLRELFARLGVFATFTLEAAEHVADADLNGIDALVEASLLKPLAGGRYLMLETIREFALERLAEGGDEDEIRERHLVYLTTLARRAKLHTEDTGAMRHDLVNPERNNVRAALEWAIETGRQAQGLALAVALENNWVTTDPDEGARWTEALLELGEPSAEQLMMAFRCLGNAGTFRGDAAGKRYYERSLELARGLGDPGSVASLLHRVAVWRVHEGDDAGAVALLDESEELNRIAKLERVSASNFLLRGDIARRGGDPEKALRLYEESRERARSSGFTWWEKNTLTIMAFTLFGLGRAEEGLARALDALRVALAMDDRPGIADALAAVARGHAEHGDVVRAGRIWGTIEREIARSPIPGWDPEDRFLVVPMRAFMGPEFDRGRAAGGDATLADVAALELQSARDT